MYFEAVGPVFVKISYHKEIFLVVDYETLTRSEREFLLIECVSNINIYPVKANSSKLKIDLIK